MEGLDLTLFGLVLYLIATAFRSETDILGQGRQTGRQQRVVHLIG